MSHTLPARLDLFLEEAGRGTSSVPALLAAVAGRAQIEVTELTPFFAKLVEKGILIAEIEVPYGCRRPLRLVAERMRSAEATAAWLPEVEAVEEEVDLLPRLAAEPRMAAMVRLADRLAALPHTRALEGDELFRVAARPAGRAERCNRGSVEVAVDVQQ